MNNFNIVVDRLKEHKKKQTTGTLKVFINNKLKYECKCLELPYKNNEKKISCVKPGTYPIVLEYSPAFKMNLWELKNVPNRSESKIHIANYVTELEGCIAPGLEQKDINGDGLVDNVNSRIAFNKIMDITKDFKYGTITINTKVV